MIFLLLFSFCYVSILPSLWAEEKSPARSIEKEREKAERILRQEEKRLQREEQKRKQQEIKELYKEALQYYSQNELTEAKKIFQQILKIDPDQKKAKIYIEKKIPARQEYLARIEQRKVEQEEKRRAREEEKLRRKEELEAKRRAKEEERLARKEELEAKRKAQQEERLARKEKLEAKIARKEEELREKEARLRAKKEELLKERTSEFITIKRVKTVLDIVQDADYLCSVGKYEDALPLYNYAYDITKDKVLKKEILAAKKKAAHALKVREKELKKKELKEERLRRKEEKEVALRAKKEELEAEEKVREEEKLRKQRELEEKRKVKEEEIRARREKQKTLNSLYKDALSYYRKDELSKAQEIFQQILKIDPDQKKAMFYIEKKIPARQKKLELLQQKRKE